jgi:hypothetical protein
MVKHYVKPGMTGLAQIKGLRGDTSVEERIHEDIAYIENWTLLLDLYILFKTPFKAFNKSEQYVEKEIRENPALYGISETSPELFEIANVVEEDNTSTEKEEETEVKGDTTDSSGKNNAEEGKETSSSEDCV